MGEANKGVNRRAESSALKRKAVSEYKMQLGCTDCGLVPEHPSMLDLDHLDPATKLDNVSDLISQDYSWAVVWKEVRKCEPVCKACHKERTAARKAAEAGTRAEKAAALGLESGGEIDKVALAAALDDLAALYWKLMEIGGLAHDV